jgi:putative ABC transport system substrate-binding protein
MSNRRRFITLLGGAAATWPMKALTQQSSAVRWIGVLMISPDGDLSGRESAAVFEQSLAKLGWTVGRNLAIDYRWGVSDVEKARLAVGQIMRLTPSVILANGGPALTAAQRLTSTVPIVFTGISEPVERGFVASLSHPGGNTTGFANLEATIAGKWLELFKEIAPRATRLSIMFNPASSFAEEFFRAAERVSQKLAIEVIASRVRNLSEIDGTVQTLSNESAAIGLMLPPDGFTTAFNREIIDLTTRHRLPVMAGVKPFVVQGGLISYGRDILDTYRRAAGYVDRILKGEKPADLPIQNPVKFELVINLKTAKALGLEVPPTLLARADEVIE